MRLSLATGGGAAIEMRPGWFGVGDRASGRNPSQVQSSPVQPGLRVATYLLTKGKHYAIIIPCLATTRNSPYVLDTEDSVWSCVRFVGAIRHTAAVVTAGGSLRWARGKGGGVICREESESDKYMPRLAYEHASELSQRGGLSD